MKSINPIQNALFHSGIKSHPESEKLTKTSQAKYKLNEFINDISKSFTEINNNAEHKKIIYNKLKERITKRENKESKWGFIHRFFHRLGHFFRGHGFITTAERAKNIQSSLELDSSFLLKNEEVPKNPPVELPKLNPTTKNDIKSLNIDTIWQNLHHFLNWPDNKNIREHLSNLTPQQIAEYVQEDVIQIPLAMSVDWKPLTELWNLDQKKAFVTAILAKENGIKSLVHGIASYGKSCEPIAKTKELDTFIDHTAFLNLFELYCSKADLDPNKTLAYKWIAEVIMLDGLKEGKWAAIEASLKSYGLEEYTPMGSLALITENKLKALKNIYKAQKEFSVSEWIDVMRGKIPVDVEINVEQVLADPIGSYGLVKKTFHIQGTSSLPFISKKEGDHSFAAALKIEHKNLNPEYIEPEAEYFDSESYDSTANALCQKENKAYLNSNLPDSHQPFTVVAFFNMSQDHKWHLTVPIATKGVNELAKNCSSMINHRNACVKPEEIFRFLTWSWTECKYTLDMMDFFLKTKEQSKIEKKDQLTWMLIRLLNGQSFELDERSGIFADSPVIGKWTVSYI